MGQFYVSENSNETIRVQGLESKIDLFQLMTDGVLVVALLAGFIAASTFFSYWLTIG
jgi:hypothetical protein